MERFAPNKKKIVLGLTGSFGSGKTTVSGILRSWGARVIDADKIARDLLIPQSRIYKKTIRVFGADILKSNGAIDRRKLGAAVFADKNLLHKLNTIIHPEVIRIIKRKVRSYRRGIIVLDAPLLIEAGLSKAVDKVIVVRIGRRQQIKRLMSKTSLDKKGILKRINAQMAQNQKVRLADFIIDNSGTIKQTKKQVQAIRRMLWKN
ncbi:MAG: dephospho-CoA kinase [Candidatus Omnitrophica bacterium]|nr:dephospho-CoA kinase [Candidatus Omnitrophota bacterium]